MSGFVGFLALIKFLEKAFEISIKENQKEKLRELLLPLSDRNVFALNINDIKEFLHKQVALKSLSNEFKIDSEKFLNYLARYLDDNLKDMI